MQDIQDRKVVKLSLFTDAINLDGENPKNVTEKLLRLLNYIYRIQNHSHFPVPTINNAKQKLRKQFHLQYMRKLPKLNFEQNLTKDLLYTESTNIMLK